ncbi:tail completion protein gp17 [Polymorphum gilvum]|uniref:DUF3168 domain-containing protein n=1 Tax=Polymorphum gilvum (strain LMG 25793 / CGMCC 1.9160 / SL003B-26A1) TaxID=991905 RepID=F2J5N7_POLGS|nr:DUF3168 domain-containing protein [Polymorphum gilvum]ADZ70121.1 hypothetical protein SL003B_1693 [Polymorphum gilvum SL003B-26A1]
MADADLIGALVAALKADGDIAALAGTRVFGGELPADETAFMPRAAIVLALSGGPSLAAGSYLPHDTQRVDALSFAATPRAANALAQACRRVLAGLRRQVVAGCLIHWAEPAGGLSARRDSDTRWPVAFQSFQVFHALEAVE